MASAGEPMKAKLGATPFSDPDWVFERKLDGIRAIAERHGDVVTLTSRTGRDLSRSYPELVAALAAEAATDFVADGEIVAFDGSRTSFAKLQGRIHLQDPRPELIASVPVHLYLFDLLRFDGHDLTGLPLRARKGALRRAFDFHGPVRYTPHRNEHGERFFEEACAKGWEGLIAKRAESQYTHRRSGDWIKLKCSREQELVIGGFTPPGGARKHFGALLIGYYEDGELRFAGKAGTGFSERTLTELGARLEALEIPESPFTRGSGLPRVARWVKPELVGQFAFSEWTRDGKLRHPSFVGLRVDKPAREVVRETPGA
ncbi:MAG TPA: non-homologous end-joining DNA ligase [Solirubrobacterales bacterium]|nr:non-homologous end-joining DNA ligase [Solirubrobacterales bacterium]